MIGSSLRLNHSVLYHDYLACIFVTCANSYLPELIIGAAACVFRQAAARCIF